mmetsp:Transcript_33494/g.49578  ORF Transcript_33494/g.49578 Transcript_33494/m.49578 type:complete len:118 (-) Transcript_33494:259-612(-)
MCFCDADVDSVDAFSLCAVPMGDLCVRDNGDLLCAIALRFVISQVTPLSLSFNAHLASETLSFHLLSWVHRVQINFMSSIGRKEAREHNSEEAQRPAARNLSNSWSISLVLLATLSC